MGKGNEYNNSGMNKNLINPKGLVLCFCLIFFMALPKVMQRNGYCIGEEINALSYINNFWISSIIMPTFYFLANPSNFRIAVDNVPFFG